MVNQAADALNHGSGSVLGKIVMTPINAVAGFGKGLLGSVFNLSGFLMSGGVVFMLCKFAPDFVAMVLSKLSGKKIEDIKQDIVTNGSGAILKYSALLGLGTNAAIGGATGAINGVMDTAGGQESSTLGKVAGFTTGALAIAGIAAVTVGAVHRSGITYKGDADDTVVKIPDPTHPKAENNASKSKV